VLYSKKKSYRLVKNGKEGKAEGPERFFAKNTVVASRPPKEHPKKVKGSPPPTAALAATIAAAETRASRPNAPTDTRMDVFVCWDSPVRALRSSVSIRDNMVTSWQHRRRRELRCDAVSLPVRVGY
jgi:hypothetical protein